VDEPRAKRPRPAEQAESTATEGTVTLATELSECRAKWCLGRYEPTADWTRTKYNSHGIYRFAELIDSKALVPFNQALSLDALKCVLAAYSRSTWAKYLSALNAFNNFEKSVGTKFEFSKPAKTASHATA
jgi:hypothetical protein